jgi:hypothetical protein
MNLLSFVTPAFFKIIMKSLYFAASGPVHLNMFQDHLNRPINANIEETYSSIGNLNIVFYFSKITERFTLKKIKRKIIYSRPTCLINFVNVVNLI